MASKIISFPGTRAAEAEVRDEELAAERELTQDQPEQPQPQPHFPATHGMVAGVLIAPHVAIAAANRVIQALQFYAKGGFDHGAAAARALIEMQAVIETATSDQQPTGDTQ